MSRNKRRVLTWSVVATVVLAITVPILAGVLGPSDSTEERPIFRVRRGPLVISVTESGTLKNREEVEIKSQVEGRAEILTLAAEGSQVEKGDLLVELDSSRLKEQLATQELKVLNADSAFVRARENHAVVKSQGESNIAQAELDLRFAKLDLEKYVEGEYPQQLKQADSDITLAKEKVQRETQKLEWSKRLHEKRYLSTVELQADEATLMQAKIDLELAEGRKSLLEKYSHRRDLAALSSDITQAENALERTKRKASADLVQADSELRTKQQELNRQKREQARIEDQITKCRIHAPVAGMVVYATTGGGWRSREEPLEEGVEVRKRQHLISLPTAASMMAEINVHESNLKKVRVGLPVHITVDAAPGKIFEGTSAKLAHMPDSQSAWLNPDLKVYDLDVHLDGGSGGDLRPGMSCRAEIFVQRYESALYLPVQCVVRVAGEPTVYVKTVAGLEARAVKIGLDNNRMVHILEGLAEGDPVVLNPPLGQGNAVKDPEVPDVKIPDAPPADGGQRPGRGERPKRGPANGKQPPSRRG
jgi:HlyD family secretion protein